MLTAEEKQELLAQIRKMILNDVIQEGERDAIYRICLVACNRELERVKRKNQW